MRDEEEDDEEVDASSGDENSGTDDKPSTTRQRLLRDFDRNIPTTHDYLGKLDNISGYTLYEDGQIIDLPAVHTDTLTFPGYTLPLVLSDADERHEMFQSGFNFVLVWIMYETREYFKYGVVMEVFERSSDGRGNFNIKARGRQRCFIPPQPITHLLVSFRGQMRGPTVRVKIIEEGFLSSPVSCTQLLTLRRKHPYKGNYTDVSTLNKYRRMHLGQFVFPYWVYDLYEVDYYVEKIVKILARYYGEEDIPTDPTSLSFWFGQNFQLTNDERLRILQCNSTLERLQNALKCLNVERRICCAQCNAQLCHQRDVFAMSKDGLQSNYVNPGGVVYETLTVRKIDNFQLEGSACKEFSWFPGYAWTIIKCRVCAGHLGWMFTARHLKPNKFYGLARRCLSILTDGEDSTD